MVDDTPGWDGTKVLWASKGCEKNNKDNATKLNEATLALDFACIEDKRSTLLFIGLRVNPGLLAGEGERCSLWLCTTITHLLLEISLLNSDEPIFH